MRNISCSISFITLCYIVEIWITFGEVQMQQMPDLPYDPKSQTYVCIRLHMLQLCQVRFLTRRFRLFLAQCVQYTVQCTYILV